MRDFRLIPVVLVAAACLLGLKVLGLVLDGGYTLTYPDASARDAPGEPPATTLMAASPAAPSAPATIPAVPSPKSSLWMPSIFSAPDVTGSSEHGAPKGEGPKAEAAKAEAAAKPKPSEPGPSSGG